MPSSSRRGPTPGIPYPGDHVYGESTTPTPERWYVGLFKTIVYSLCAGLIAGQLVNWWTGPPLQINFPTPRPPLKQSLGSYISSWGPLPEGWSYTHLMIDDYHKAVTGNCKVYQ